MAHKKRDVLYDTTFNWRLPQFGGTIPCRVAIRLIMFLAAFAVAAPITAQEPAIQRSFGGQSVHMDLSSGHYRLTTAVDDRIRVTPLTKNGSQANNISVRLNVNLFGTRADLRVRVTSPREGLEVQIELPKRVNLVARLADGSLQVSGIEGSKDIESKSGNVEVSLGDRDQYKRVTASVRSGDLTAPAFDDGGSGPRSFEWTGKGSYEIRIRLHAGRLTLR
jgi:hypothetical protein